MNEPRGVVKTRTFAHPDTHVHIHAFRKFIHMHIHIRMPDLRQHRKRLYQLLRLELVVVSARMLEMHAMNRERLLCSHYVCASSFSHLSIGSFIFVFLQSLTCAFVNQLVACCVGAGQLTNPVEAAKGNGLSLMPARL